MKTCETEVDRLKQTLREIGSLICQGLSGRPSRLEVDGEPEEEEDKKKED